MKISTINPTVYIDPAGCNRRLAELFRIQNYLQKNGYQIVRHPGKARLICVGTCAFKKEEEEESVSRLRRLTERFTAEFLVMGCLADIAPDRFREFSHLPHVSPRDIHRIEEYIPACRIRFSEVPDTHPQSVRFSVCAIPRLFMRKARRRGIEGIIRSVGVLSDHVRRSALASRTGKLIVGHGCQGRCSYCAIKHAIGTVSSKPLSTIREELHELLSAGFRSITLIGDDIGCYGLDIHSSFPELLRTLLETCEAHRCTGIQNEISFGIYELHPKWLLRYRRELIDILHSKRIAKILCPIQSGNGRILELMHREHSAEDLLEAFTEIKRTYPNVVLTTQIIVGFPSETQEEFVDTLSFIRKVCFQSVVLFPYHEKECTPASRLPDRVPEKVIQNRLWTAVKELRKAGIKTYFSCPD